MDRDSRLHALEERVEALVRTVQSMNEVIEAQTEAIGDLARQSQHIDEQVIPFLRAVSGGDQS